MTARVGLALVAGLLLCSAASAQVEVITLTSFDSYPNSAAFQAEWVPTIGNGTAPANAADVSAGLLTDDPLVTFVYPDLQGKAVDHIGATASTPGMVNQWGGVINQDNGMDGDFLIAPSAAQNVFLSYDLFDGASGNERMSIGLRHISVSGGVVTTSNIIEMGLYNTNSADPFVVGVANPPSGAAAGSPGFYPGRGYAARIQLFGARGADDRGQLQVTPDWQYFFLPQELDRPAPTMVPPEPGTDNDEIVTIGDIGQGWHRYTATITPETVTFTIDLWRDGKRNTSKTPDENGDRPGTDGVDATMSFPIAAQGVGFNALRIGGPSGLLSGGGGANAFDNILLQLQPPAPSENADFDGNTIVDSADLALWSAGFGMESGATPGDGDANGDGAVDGRDYLIWQRLLTPSPPVSASVPEPASAAIAAAMLLGFASLVRRRT